MAERNFKLGDIAELPSFEENTASPSINRNEELSALVNDFNANPIVFQPSSSKNTDNFEDDGQRDITRSFETGVEELKGSTRHFLAAGATVLGFDEFADDQIKAAEANKAEGDRLSEGLIRSFDDANDFGDYFDRSINGLAGLAPAALETIVGAVAGAAIGTAVAPGAGTVSGALAGGAAKIAGKKGLQVLIKDYVKNKGYKDLVGKTAKQQAQALRRKKIAEDALKKFAGTAGSLVASVPQIGGEVFGEAIGAGASKDDAAKTALLLALPLSGLDSILPASIIKDIAAKSVKEGVGAAAKKGVEGFVKEGVTETAQEEALIQVKSAFDDDFDVTGDEANSRRREAFLLGGLAGGVGAGGASAIKSGLQKKGAPDAKTPITNQDFTDKGVKKTSQSVDNLLSTRDELLKRTVSSEEQDPEFVKESIKNVDADLARLQTTLEEVAVDSEGNKGAAAAEAVEVLQSLEKSNRDNAKADLQISEAQEVEVEQEVIEEEATNPTHDDLDTLSARAIGIGSSIDHKLSQTQADQVALVIQSRLKSLPDQSVDTESALQSLRGIIEEDVRSVVRSTDADTVVEDAQASSESAEDVPSISVLKESKSRVISNLLKKVVKADPSIDLDNLSSSNISTIRSEVAAKLDNKNFTNKKAREDLTSFMNESEDVPDTTPRTPSSTEIRRIEQANSLPKKGAAKKGVTTSKVTPTRKLDSVIDTNDVGIVEIDGSTETVKVIEQQGDTITVQTSKGVETIPSSEYEVSEKPKSSEDLLISQMDIEESARNSSGIEEGVDVAVDVQLKAIELEIAAKAKEEPVLSSEDSVSLSTINSQIGELQDIKSSLDPELDVEERREIQREISALHASKIALTSTDKVNNVQQATIKETRPNTTSNILVTDDSTSTSYQTVSNDADVVDVVEPNPEESKGVQGVVDRMTSELDTSISDIKVFYAPNVEAYNTFRSERDKSFKDISADQFANVKAEAIVHGPNKHTVILGSNIRTPEEAAVTLVHELVGHVGGSITFGDKYKSFHKAMLESNRALRNDILSLSKRWGMYTSAWKRDNPDVKLTSANSYAFKDGSGNAIRIHKDVAVLLSEEYLADLATIKLNGGSFNVKANLRDGYIKRVLKRLKHFTRKILGSLSTQVNEEDMLAAIAANTDTIFKNSANLSFLQKDINQDTINTILKFRASSLNLKPDGTLRAEANIGSGFANVALPKNLKVNKAEKGFLDIVLGTEHQINPNDLVAGESAARTMGASAKITTGVTRAMNTGFGKLNQAAHVKFANEVGRRIQSHPLARHFSSLGSLPYKDAYNAVQSVTKGKLGKLEKMSRSVNKSFKSMTPFQSKIVFEHFTTKQEDEITFNESIETLRSAGISSKDITLINDAKETIESLGEQLVSIGMLNEDSFEENRGSYLPRRYLKYLNVNLGGGKRVSALNFLRKDKDLDENTKAMLGEIKDPSFLVAETIGMLGRDVAILQMFESLAENGKTGATSWVLNDESFVNFRGERRTFDWLNKEISRIETILKDDSTDTSGAFQLTESQRDFNRSALNDLQTANQEGEAAMLEKVAEEARLAGQPDIDPEIYRSEHYKKIGDNPRFGKLRGLWVRKEIHNDLKGVMQSFEIDPDDTLTKIFGSKGLLVKANGWWKMMKVPFNVPSWFRNTVGNFTLLDISSNRSSPELTKMFAEEVGNAVRGKESKYWLMAVDNGLFGTTYAATELYGQKRDFEAGLSQADRLSAITSKSKLMPMMSHMQEHFLNAADMAGRGFGHLEGSFKTVAMRDHIEAWEVQNDTKLEALDKESQTALILEAVNHANGALFDYSQVPPTVDALRRYPLGSPFITFMYKSFPTVIESLAKRPQKFIKYAAFPMLMSTLAQSMNDWSDDDMDKLEALLPEWTRTKSSTFILPFKDSNNQPQFAEYGYALPWSPFIDSGLKIADHFDSHNISSTLTSTLEAGGQISDDLGFLGGPLPQLITSWKANTDSFTGQPIMNPGDNPDQKMGDMSAWLWNIASPSYLSSHGFLGQLYDQLDTELPGLGQPEPENSFGKVKRTLGQVAGSLSGFPTRSFEPKDSRNSTLKNFARKLKEISISRSKFAKKTKPGERRAAGLKEFNLRKKLIIKQRKEFVDSTKNIGGL